MAKLFVEWTDDLSVGIQEIDNQHKILIDLINRLFDETVLHQAGSDTTVIDEVLYKLVEYTVIHFTVEESLFRIFSYPDTDTHIGHHNELKAQVIDLQQKVKRGEAQVNTELLLFLKNWLTNHINYEDKLYAPFFLKQGANATKKKSWFG